MYICPNAVGCIVNHDVFWISLLQITERSVSVQIIHLLALLKEVKFRDISSGVRTDMASPFMEGLKREFARQNMQVVLVRILF
jgi:hypothetical protein